MKKNSQLNALLIVAGISGIMSCKPMQNSASEVRTSSATESDALSEEALAQYLRENGSGDVVAQVLESQRQVIAMERTKSDTMALTGDANKTKAAVCAKYQLAFIAKTGKGLCMTIDGGGKKFWVQISGSGLSFDVSVSVAVLIFEHHKSVQRYTEMGVAAGGVGSVAVKGGKFAAQKLLSEVLKKIPVGADLLYASSAEYGSAVLAGPKVGLPGTDLSLNTTLEVTEAK